MQNLSPATARFKAAAGLRRGRFISLAEYKQAAGEYLASGESDPYWTPVAEDLASRS
jgi:hypothetical protein